MVRTFNRWYDGLAPTPRFLLFMLMSVLSFGVLEFGITAGMPVLAAIGLFNTAIMVIIAAGRAMSHDAPSHRFAGGLIALGFALVALFTVIWLIVR
jgi:hypothetical protein